MTRYFRVLCVDSTKIVSLSILATALFFSTFLFSGNSFAQPPENSTASRKNLKKSTRPVKDGKVVDLQNKVVFSLTLGKENEPEVDFTNSSQKTSRVPNGNQESIENLLKPEFKEPNSADGVVIRVAKNVKYDMVNSLFKSIRAALDNNKIDKPVYIKIENPKPQEDSDEIRTQEFICKNKKAADLYDRVSNVARVFKVSVRLDPARNSITAKGASSKVTAIQNLINYLDKPVTAPGATTPPDSPSKSTPNSPSPKKSAGNPPPKKSPSDIKEKSAEKGNVPPPNVQTDRPQELKTRHGFIAAFQFPIIRWSVPIIGRRHQSISTRYSNGVIAGFSIRRGTK